MTRRDFLQQIPYGTRDFLPKEAAQKRTLETALSALFGRWGYDEVVTPTFEFLDTFNIGIDSDMAKYLFKFFDKDNLILALRPDMTAPMARVAASRLKNISLPLRLFYLTNVFRQEEAQMGVHCEFYQAGIELLGAADAAADAEVVALAAESLLKAGLRNFKIGLGQAGFINGVMAESGLELAEQQKIKYSIVKRDLVSMAKVLKISGLREEMKKMILDIPLLNGGDEALESAYKLVKNKTGEAALDNLANIKSLLTSYGFSEYINFDLGLIRDLDYYTGMVFEAYTYGLGFPLLGGGRYDNMAASFGASYPATGFALGIERVLLALEKQKITLGEQLKEIYIGWGEGCLNEAIREAGRLRREGKVVELAVGAKSKSDSEKERLAKGYLELKYIDKPK